MPFKSKAQQKYMNAAATRGEIEQSVVDEFNDASRGKTKKLPEKVKPKKNGLKTWADHRDD
jgi:hypothetical protein